MNEWIDEQRGGLMYGWTNRGLDRWMDLWTYEWMDVCIIGCICIYKYQRVRQRTNAFNNNVTM